MQTDYARNYRIEKRKPRKHRNYARSSKNIKLSKENENMKERMTKVKKKIEEKEKNEKCNNIVIKGIEIEETNAQENIERFIHER